jgi:sugar lactone lactonase YvrE
MTLGPDGRLYVTQVFGSQVTAIDVDTGAHEVFSPLGSGIVGPDDGIFAADGTFYATEPLFGRVTARRADGTYVTVRDDLPAANGVTMDHARQRLFIDEFRPGGRLLEVDPTNTAGRQVLMEDLNGPNAPAMGPDGRLYFPQVFANEIWVYDLEAGQGRLAFADLSVPTAVKFDSRGRLVTSESGAGRITAIDITTGARETLAEVPKGIDNLSIGDGDRLFVSHYVDGRVAEMTGNRERMLSEPGLLGPFGLVVAADGRLLVADGLSIAAVHPDAAIHRLLTLLIDLHTLAIGVAEMAGDLVVLAPAELLLYARGSTEPSVLIDGLAAPAAVLADGPDAVLVTERDAGTVSRVQRDGTKSVVARGLRRPAAIARLRDGGIAVTQAEGIVVIAPDGTTRELGGFDDPQGVAALGSRLLVADVGRGTLVSVDVASGKTTAAVTGAPIGQAVPGVVPAAFCPICPDGEGGVLVGCNGDGSIRRLTPA